MRVALRFFISLFFILLLTSLEVVEVNAMNDGFVTESLSKHEKNIVVDNLDLFFITEEPPKKAIECFSVSDNGLIAIGCSQYDKKSVCIYTDDGVFKYGYSFKCNGNFGVELNGDVLNIYFVRADVAVIVNSEGRVDNILKIQNTSKNNLYWQNNVFATKREIGNVEYVIENDLGFFDVFMSSYSRLKVINNGRKSIIYDVNSFQLTKIIVIFIGILVFVCIIAIVVFLKLSKYKRKD